MTTNYTPLLQLALPTTGELDGTWGDVVNQNITSMVEEAVAGRAVVSTWTANSHTLTVANGTTDEARCAILDLQTGSGGTALSAAGELICPATSKIYVVNNGAAYSVTIKTASGSGVTIADGQSSIVFCDGTDVIQANSSSAGAGIPVGAGVFLPQTSQYTTIDGNVYMAGGFNDSVDPAKHDIATLKTNNPAILNYITQRVSGVASALTSAAYSSADGIYVVVGASGVILTSPDGVTWTQRTSPVSTTLNQVVYGAAPDDLFVAVGASGVIITSPDGITWTSRTSGLSTNIVAVTYNTGSGVFVAVDASGTVISSSDGLTWTRSFTSETRNKIVYGSGPAIYVTVCNGGAIYTTTDLTTWTSRTSGTTQNLNGVAYSSADTLFVAVGNGGVILTSPDGVTWTSRTSGTSQILNRVTYSAALDLFVAVGNNGVILTSPDGVTWTSRTSGSTAQLTAVAYSPADTLFVVGAAAGVVYTSPDGITWTQRTPNSGNVGRAIATNGSLYVIVGNGGEIVTTADFVSFTRRTSGTTSNLYGIAYSSVLGLFAACGEGVIITSPDGITWTSRTLPSGWSTSWQFYDMGVNPTNGRFVMPSWQGYVAYSSDGITWTAATATTGAFAAGMNCVAYSTATSTFVIGGYSTANVWTSSDGISWTTVTTPFGATTTMSGCRYISALNKFFGTVVQNATTSVNGIYSSSDGVTWSQVYANPGAASNLGYYPSNAIVWDANLNKVVVGCYGSGIQFSASSSDGITWSAGAYQWVTPNISNTSAIYVAGLGVVYCNQNTAIGSYSVSADGNNSVKFNYGMPLQPFLDAAYDSTNDQFIGVASGGYIYTSQDGIAWARRYNTSSPTWANYTTQQLNSVAYNSTAGKTVIVGASGVALYSSNSTTYTVTTLNAGTTQANGVASTSTNGFVAVGNSSLAATTPDGITWTTSFFAAAISGQALAYSSTANLYALGGASGFLATSADAATWTVRSSGTSFGINSVAYGNGKFVAVATAGNANTYPASTVILTSTDGVTWSSSAYHAPTFGTAPTVTYNNTTGYYTIVYGSSNLYGAILKSTDAVTWTASGVPTELVSNTIRTVPYANVAGVGNYTIMLGVLGYLGTSADSYASDPVSVGFPTVPSAQATTYTQTPFIRTK